MRSSNEHSGAGLTIPIPSVPLTSLVSPGELMAMSKNEMKDLTDRKEKQEAEGVAKALYGNINSRESAQLLLL